MSLGDTLKKVLKELSRRNLIRVAGVYIPAAWVILQLSGALESSLNLPTWFDTLVVTLLVVCFPISLILAWAHNTTPIGNQPQRQAGNHASRYYLDGAIGVGLVVVLIFMVFQTMSKPDSGVSPIKQVQLSATIVNQAGEPITNANVYIKQKNKKLLDLPATSDFRGIAKASFTVEIGQMVEINISANEYQHQVINLLVDSQLLAVGNITLNKIKPLKISKLVHSISAGDDLQYIDFFVKNNETDSVLLQKIKLQGVKRKHTECLSGAPSFLVSINKQQNNHQWLARTQNKHDNWSDNVQLHGEVEILPCKQARIDFGLSSLMRVSGNSEDKIRVAFPRYLRVRDNKKYLLEVEKWDSFLVSLVTDKSIELSRILEP